MKELIIDNFAGGGGASTGIELATGRSVDIAINHDPAAILMHKTNHPATKHYCESVWEVDPVEAVGNNKVALAWFSPDCKHFSKAKGSKPVDKNIRGLAWVAVKWAKLVKPRVIMLENVEEFKTWGPLKEDGKGNLYPDPNKKGQTFELFKKALEKQGYKVEFRELRACDYGAPTTRKRFFMIARCDGKPIVWPESTHGDPEQIEVRCGLLKPWRTAGEIIDWSIPCPSIFTRKKPLAENTLRRIAKGFQKFVIDNANPFIVRIGQTGFAKDGLQYELDSPLTTITTKAEHLLIAPFLTSYHSETQQGEVRGLSLDNPIHTLDTSNRFGLVAAFITRQFKSSIGHKIDEPLATVTTVDKSNLVTAFLLKYYGTDIGQKINEPLHTITTKDRFGLVTIKGEDYRIIDIGMRMLQPHELFKAQGFPEDYIIDHDYEGSVYPKTKQVARCGNAVPPPFAKALVEANLPELCKDRKSEKVS
ncbi:DNA cytosine methyltransferase [Clostridium botulinum]|uniref:DNA (cytosine-5-)-methyltransferase n=1 Tax=Clostridium botulinum (strain Langeland / NCTC 10281 / Type F) TaxID=441772 RepID=A7GFW5_CLOBL|nr:DNA cytosine methyltransferase [Clostridium botulinum]ABS40976.1 C-5 cytosine-specific DNA methylase [Clostridium botulinum F str. Langeland]ADG00084.1 C-5 cytosine-specific DNA methylase [Clostridium botulinum F str. 230613]KKM42367.1 DNA methyltransferase [Clostridium botulinum]MBY6793154.1 DNA cytosine methyltransferase [Clostridium botulinum]MBY6937364.1 DNA cytosine methyltransferase [Clostridium botulinum]